MPLLQPWPVGGAVTSVRAPRHYQVTFRHSFLPQCPVDPDWWTAQVYIVMFEESILRKLGLHSDQPFIRFTCLRPLLDNLRQSVCSVHCTAPKFTTFVKWFKKDKQPHSIIFGRKVVMINPEGREKHRKRRKHAFRTGIFRPKKVRSNMSFRK